MSFSRIKGPYKHTSVLTFTVEQWLSRASCTLPLFLVQTVITAAWDYSAIRAISPRYVTGGKKTRSHGRHLSWRPRSTAKTGEICSPCPSCDRYQIVDLRRRVTWHPHHGDAVSLPLMRLRPKSLLITFTSVSPPAAERNCFTRPLGLVPTLLSAREGEDAAKLMTVFTNHDAFHLFPVLVFWLIKSFS